MAKYNNNHNGGRGKKLDYETKVVRLPIDILPLVNEVLEYYLSNNYTLPDITLGNNIPLKTLPPDLSERINQIKENINNDVTGYRKNNASRLVKDILNL